MSIIAPMLGLLIRVILCFGFIFLPLNSLDEWFYDKFFKIKLERKKDPSIVLIYLPDTELQKMGIIDSRIHVHTSYSLVWYRSIYEPLINRLGKLSPKVIAFTTFYDRTDDPGYQIPPNRNIVFSALLNENQTLLLPPLTLVYDLQVGFNNLFPDYDQVVRRTHLIYSNTPSLAVTIYKQIHKKSPERNLVEPLWISYDRNPSTFPSFSYNDVIEGQITKEQIENKIVLIGRDHSLIRNINTPVGKMSPLEIHGHILEGLINKKEIIHLGSISNYLISIACCVLAVTFILFSSLKLSWALLVLSSLVYLVFCHLLFSVFNYWAAIANPLVCLFGSYMVLLGFKLTREQEKHWQMEQESKALREMDQFKNNFISLFSHDLKTPIAKIKALTNQIVQSEKSLSHIALEILSKINAISDSLAKSISDILKITRMESGAIERAFDSVDLNRLVSDTVSQLKFLADEKKVKLIQDIEPLFPIEGDKKLIQEVIFNLLENAIKYSPHEKQIVIKTFEKQDRLYFSVKDEGEGISEEELPKITTKFYRGKTAQKTTSGTGLGLYLAKYFIELHSGKLEIKSKVNLGTEVLFWLPISS